jgi:hypothetical protein
MADEIVAPVVEPIIEKPNDVPPILPTENDPPVTPEANKPAERIVPAADSYKLPEGAPAELGKFANEHGFTQEQLDAAMQQFEGITVKSRTAELEALKKQGTEFISKWGDQAEYNVSLARRALKQNDPNGTLTAALKETGYANHPAVLEFLHTIGKSMEEGGFLKNSAPRPAGKKSLAQKMFGNHPSNES